MCTHYAGTEYKKKMDVGIQSKIKYCKKHNIDFILEDENADYFDNKRRYEWYKILLLKKHINNYDYLFWSDADVLIKNFDFSLTDYINNADPNNIFIFTHCPNFFINNGNFFVKNTPDTIQILDLIYSQTQFLNVNCCEQTATVYVLQNYPNIYSKTYIEKKSRLFNAYSIYNWSKINDPLYYRDGDFLIHYAGINTELTSSCMSIDSKHNYLTRKLYFEIHDNLPLFYYNNLPLIDFDKINNIFTNNINNIKQLILNQNIISDSILHLDIELQYINPTILHNFLNLFWISTLSQKRFNNLCYIGHNNILTPFILLHQKYSTNDITLDFINKDNSKNNIITNLYNNININNYEQIDVNNTYGIIYFNLYNIDFNNNSSYILYIFNKIHTILIPQGVLIINAGKHEFLNSIIDRYIQNYNYKELDILQPTTYRIIQKYYK